MFNVGDRVRKKSGTWWEGKVVGYYSTARTQHGYCVQMDEKPDGPVQIYPADALELIEPPVGGKSITISPREAAKALIDCRRRDNNTVGYRSDLWNALEYAVTGDLVKYNDIATKRDSVFTDMFNMRVLGVLAAPRRQMITAETLAKSFGVSDRTMYRAIKRLRRAGFRIEAAPGLGMRVRVEDLEEALGRVLNMSVRLNPPAK